MAHKIQCICAVLMLIAVTTLPVSAEEKSISVKPITLEQFINANGGVKLVAIGCEKAKAIAALAEYKIKVNEDSLILLSVYLADQGNYVLTSGLEGQDPDETEQVNHSNLSIKVHSNGTYYQNKKYHNNVVTLANYSTSVSREREEKYDTQQLIEKGLMTILTSQNNLEVKIKKPIFIQVDAFTNRKKTKSATNLRAFSKATGTVSNLPEIDLHAGINQKLLAKIFKHDNDALPGSTKHLTISWHKFLRDKDFDIERKREPILDHRLVFYPQKVGNIGFNIGQSTLSIVYPRTIVATPQQDNHQFGDNLFYISSSEIVAQKSQLLFGHNPKRRVLFQELYLDAFKKVEPKLADTPLGPEFIPNLREGIYNYITERLLVEIPEKVTKSYCDEVAKEIERLDFSDDALKLLLQIKADKPMFLFWRLNNFIRNAELWPKDDRSQKGNQVFKFMQEIDPLYYHALHSFRWQSKPVSELRKLKNPTRWADQINKILPENYADHFKQERATGKGALWTETVKSARDWMYDEPFNLNGKRIQDNVLRKMQREVPEEWKVLVAYYDNGTKTLQRKVYWYKEQPADAKKVIDGLDQTHPLLAIEPARSTAPRTYEK